MARGKEVVKKEEPSRENIHTDPYFTLRRLPREGEIHPEQPVTLSVDERPIDTWGKYEWEGLVKLGVCFEGGIKPTGGNIQNSVSFTVPVKERWRKDSFKITFYALRAHDHDYWAKSKPLELEFNVEGERRKGRRK